jgi:5-hydroxyisourate hydrolase-like protein (transthyretin family)
MTMRIAALLLLLQFPNILPTPGKIEGTVLRAGTREPVPDVQVLLFSTARSDSDPFRTSTWSAITDAAGRYALKNVTPGTYRLTFAANRYVRQEYGQRTFPGNGTQIRVAPGETVKDLETVLTPTGSVSGTIRDDEKRPLIGVPVQLLQFHYDWRGERELRPVGTAGQTDDRGEFRISFVTPGRYYLDAGTRLGPLRPGSEPPPNQVREAFAHVYYPGVDDLQFAMPVDIQPGVLTTVTALTMKKVAGVRINGRIIDSATGQPPEKPEITLFVHDAGSSSYASIVTYGHDPAKYNKDTGTFEFRGVLPGSYALSVAVVIPEQPGPMPGRHLKRIGFLPLEIRNADVEGIVVTTTPTSSIEGRVRVQGFEDWKSAALQGVNPGVGLEPSSNGGSPSKPSRPWPDSDLFHPDGTFKITNVMPGEFRLDVAGLPSNVYVKEARFASMDLLAGPFQFTGKESGTLEIVLDSKVGFIEGTVTNKDFRSAPGAQVVLVPDKSRHLHDRFKTTTTNQDGHFSIANVPPGAYRLYAWEAVEPYRWFDPDFLKASEQFASPVQINESSRKTIDARLIPDKN